MDRVERGAADQRARRRRRYGDRGLAGGALPRDGEAAIVSAAAAQGAMSHDLYRVALRANSCWLLENRVKTARILSIFRLMT